MGRSIETVGRLNGRRGTADDLSRIFPGGLRLFGFKEGVLESPTSDD